MVVTVLGLHVPIMLQNLPIMVFGISPNFYVRHVGDLNLNKYNELQHS